MCISLGNVDQHNYEHSRLQDNKHICTCRYECYLQGETKKHFVKALHVIGSVPCSQDICCKPHRNLILDVVSV